MANKKINQLVSKTAILSTDLFGIGDATTGQLFKKTIAELQAAIGGAVISVNGLVGTVVLDTDDIQELATPTNKYFTDARARGAISLTVTGNSGASTYSSGTGVLNVPTYTLAGLGGITASFLSGTSGITYNSSTGVISYSGTVYTDSSIRALLSGGTGITYNSSTGAISYSGTVYTDSSVRALISITTTGTSGASTYNNTTGVINVPEYTLAGLGGISLTSLSGGTGITYNNTTGAISYSGTVYTDASVRALISASGAVSYNNTTGVISLTSGNLTEATSSVLTITGGTGAVLGSGTSIQVKQASTTISGFLSSTDWNTFNGKASALSGTTNYVAKFTSSTAIGNSLIYDNGTNVGIGTASPSTLFYIKTTGDGYNMYTIEATGGDAGIALKGGSGGTSVGGWTIQGQNGGSMVFVDRNSTATTRLTLTSAGFVGIGSSSPTNPLHVETTGADLGIQVYRNVSSDGGSAPLFFSHKSTAGTIKTVNIEGIGSGDMLFRTGATGLATFGTTRMVITSGGNILIGTSTNYNLGNDLNRGLILNVGSSGYAPFIAFRTNNVSKGVIYCNDTEMIIYTQTSIPTIFGTNDTDRGRITAGGNWLLGTSSDNGERLYVSGAIRATSTITANSDIRIKSNITKIENALEKVGQISGYTYNTTYDNKRHGGVIAQEMEKVFPEIVNTGNDGLMGVEYGNISALLIEAIKEQKKEIDELRTIIASK